MREISEDDRERHQRHQRTYAAASFDHLELLCFARAERHQLNDVSLA